MKTLEDILDRIYALINKTSVTSLLDGRIYRHKKPLNDKLKNIVLTCLPLRPEVSFDNGNPLSQTGVIHANCYAKNLTNGQMDETSINAIMAAVILLIASSTTELFELQISGQHIFIDPDEDDMSIGSIRINYIIRS